MKVSEVIFKRNYAISPLTHEHMHLGATVVVEENESPEEALKLAQKTVEDFYANAVAGSGASDYFTDRVIDYKKTDKEEIDRENNY